MEQERLKRRSLAEEKKKKGDKTTRLSVLVGLGGQCEDLRCAPRAPAREMTVPAPHCHLVLSKQAACPRGASS